MRSRRNCLAVSFSARTSDPSGVKSRPTREPSCRLRACSGDPLAPGGEPLAPGGEPLAPGGDPLAPGGEPLAPGGDPLAALQRTPLPATTSSRRSAVSRRTCAQFSRESRTLYSHKILVSIGELKIMPSTNTDLLLSNVGDP
jgi:hypothetical protein